MAEDLKPCPFCGEQPKSYWCGASEVGDDGYWAIECCHVYVHEDDEDDAAHDWNLRFVHAQDAAAHSPDECGRECQYYDYFEMLWNWFADESRNGSEDMRANIPDGLSADDFKNMLDEHEAALMADIAMKQPEPRTPAACECDTCGAYAMRMEAAEAENIRLHALVESARKQALVEAMKAIEDLRIRAATNFADDNCKGQRGVDRCDALYDAYRAIVALPVTSTVRQPDGGAK